MGTRMSRSMLARVASSVMPPGAVGAHAAGVGAGVVVGEALVILAGVEDEDVAPVDESEDGDLVAFERSSMTTVCPASPKIRLSMMASTASCPS